MSVAECHWTSKVWQQACDMVCGMTRDMRPPVPHRLIQTGRETLRRWVQPSLEAAAPQDVAGLQRENDRLRRALRDIEAANAAKSRFVALASHELRTPLHGILGMADLLERTSLSPEQASYVGAMRSSGSALLTLVDDVLDIGKIEAGRLDFTATAVALEPLLEEVVELLAPRAQAKGLELAAHVSTSVPASVMADAPHLARILMNLAGNAIKFTASGGVAIDMTAAPSPSADPGRRRLSIEVRDTGVGIAREDQERVFGEYEQAAGPGGAAWAGTGLGLAISRTIARTMGGDITLDSDVGAGSTFRFAVDLPVSGAALPPMRVLAGKRILILSTRTIEPPRLMRRLYDLGAMVQLVRTTDDAVHVVEGSEPPDAVLVDHGGAFDAGPALQRLAASRPDLPMAVLLTPGDRAHLGRLRAEGAMAHLIKPVRTASLIKVVEALTAGRPLALPAATTPLPAAASPSPIAPHSPEPVDPSEPEGLTVLLVDDNDINILLGRTHILALGHALDVARNGQEAVDLAVARLRGGRPYDIVLMDLHMPVMDGFAAIEAIRQAEVGTGLRTRVMALSADNTEATTGYALSAGVDATLVKPISQSDLARLLDETLAARRAGQPPEAPVARLSSR